MPKTRRLSDLYVTGKLVTLDDGEGEVSVWLQKLNPVDHESALRNANAARAHILALKKRPDDPTYLSILADVLGQDRASLVGFLTVEEASKKAPAIEAELAAEEQWSKDDLLQSLRDSWEETMKDRYAEDPEDAEAKRVFEQLKEFADSVNEAVDAERERLERDYGDMEEDALIDLVMERMIQTQADLAWLTEYRRQEIYLATREEEHHKKRYFANRDEVDELSQEIFVALANAYRSISMDVTEGKGSRVTPGSSPSSEQPEKAETEASSGQQAVTA